MNRILGERGIGIVEALGAISISSIMILGIMQSQVITYRSANKVFNDLAAAQLAEEKIETLKLSDPITLDDSDDQTETNVTRGTSTFTRVTNVTVNYDRSRTISVSVYNSYSRFGTNITIAETLSRWGKF